MMTDYPSLKNEDVEKLKTSPTKTKEAVGKPTKLSLAKGVKTGIISIFTGKNRKERRLKARNRVRNNTFLTSHPSEKEARKKAYEIRKARNLKKNTRKN